MLDGPKIVRMELMVTAEMYAAIVARARRIADGDGQNYHAEAIRQLVAEGAGPEPEIQATDIARAREIGAAFAARESAKRARRRATAEVLCTHSDMSPGGWCPACEIFLTVDR